METPEDLKNIAISPSEDHNKEVVVERAKTMVGVAAFFQQIRSKIFENSPTPAPALKKEGRSHGSKGSISLFCYSSSDFTVMAVTDVKLNTEKNLSSPSPSLSPTSSSSSSSLSSSSSSSSSSTSSTVAERTNLWAEMRVGEERQKTEPQIILEENLSLWGRYFTFHHNKRDLKPKIKVLLFQGEREIGVFELEFCLGKRTPFFYLKDFEKDKKEEKGEERGERESGRERERRGEEKGEGERREREWEREREQSRAEGRKERREGERKKKRREGRREDRRGGKRRGTGLFFILLFSLSLFLLSFFFLFFFFFLYSCLMHHHLLVLFIYLSPSPFLSFSLSLSLKQDGIKMIEGKSDSLSSSQNIFYSLGLLTTLLQEEVSFSLFLLSFFSFSLFLFILFSFFSLLAFSHSSLSLSLLGK